MKKVLITLLILIMIGGIILATREIVKGHCGNSKCTYDVYTKEKVDELLETQKNDITTTLNQETTTLNQNINNVNEKATLKNKVELISVKIELQKKKDNGGYETFKTLNVDMPINFAKSGAMVRLYAKFTEHAYQSETKAEVIDNRLHLYISNSDTSTLTSEGRIWISSANATQLEKYTPIYETFKTISNPHYAGSYVSLFIQDEVFNMVVTAHADETGDWIGAFTYMADNTD